MEIGAAGAGQAKVSGERCRPAGVGRPLACQTYFDAGAAGVTKLAAQLPQASRRDPIAVGMGQYRQPAGCGNSGYNGFNGRPFRLDRCPLSACQPTPEGVLDVGSVAASHELLGQMQPGWRAGQGQHGAGHRSTVQIAACQLRPDRVDTGNSLFQDAAQMSAERARAWVQPQAHEVNFAAAPQGSEFTGVQKLDAVLGTGLCRARTTGHRVVVGECQQLHLAYRGQRHQFSRAQRAIRPGAVGVQIDACVHQLRACGCGVGSMVAIIANTMKTTALLEAHWAGIDHVLLDLDGTLLDLDFDNHFWQTLVPEVWGAERGLDLLAARTLLQPRFAACQGTLPWYSTAHWSRELGLDIVALKRQDAGRIRWLPGAQQFLNAARARGKRLVLLTNAHPQVLALKHERTGVLDHFDASFSSHEFGAPKEDPLFWRSLQRVEPYNAARSLFVDDSATVLRAARAAGIGLVRAIRKPGTVHARHGHEEFCAVDALLELLGPQPD